MPELNSFSAALRAGEGDVRVVQPQRDRLWLRQAGGHSWLDVGGKPGSGKTSYTMDEVAMARLCQFLGIGATLWQTLAGLKVAEGQQAENYRLANKLLWHKGEQDASVALVLERTRVVDVRNVTFSRLSGAMVADRLDKLIARGAVEISKWHVSADGYWCVGHYPTRKDGFARPNATKPDLWSVGFVLANMERRDRSAMVVPGLVRAWGGLFLPLPKALWRNRGHGRTSSDALLDALFADVSAFEAIDVSSMADALTRCVEGRWRSSGIRRDVGSEWKDKELQEVVEKTGDATYAYSFVTAALGVAGKQDDIFKRLERSADVTDFALRLAASRKGAPGRVAKTTDTPGAGNA